MAGSAISLGSRQMRAPAILASVRISIGESDLAEKSITPRMDFISCLSAPTSTDSAEITITSVRSRLRMSAAVAETSNSYLPLSSSARIVRSASFFSASASVQMVAPSSESRFPSGSIVIIAISGAPTRRESRSDSLFTLEMTVGASADVSSGSKSSVTLISSKTAVLPLACIPMLPVR